jgi:hypothetical protein
MRLVGDSHNFVSIVGSDQNVARTEVNSKHNISVDGSD